MSLLTAVGGGRHPLRRTAIEHEFREVAAIEAASASRSERPFSRHYGRILTQRALRIISARRQTRLFRAYRSMLRSLSSVIFVPCERDHIVGLVNWLLFPALEWIALNTSATRLMPVDANSDANLGERERTVTHVREEEPGIHAGSRTLASGLNRTG